MGLREGVQIAAAVVDNGQQREEQHHVGNRLGQPFLVGTTGPDHPQEEALANKTAEQQDQDEQPRFLEVRQVVLYSVFHATDVLISR